MTYTVAIIDDEQAVKWALEHELRDQGYRLLTGETSGELWNFFDERKIDLVLLDMKLKDENGLDILIDIKEKSPETAVIMMTGFADIETAIESIKRGAFDYVTKPFNLEELKLRITKALDDKDLKSEVNSIRSKQKSKYSTKQIVGSSDGIRKVLDTVSKVAKSKASTVLICGPSGTGKELIARAIHYSSERADKPFVEVNCTAIPESLLESEIFGHVKGAFTDAKEERKGVVEQADKGTLFLDEIGDMPEKMQVKLLRVLQERRFKRIGGTQDIEVDIRVVAATNRNLEEAVQEKEFREDLYYRLKVIPIFLPSLAERKEDIIPIARHYIEIFNRELSKKVNKISPEAEYVLCNYAWPGNVRELKNVIERAMILECEDVLLAEHLALPVDVSEMLKEGNIKSTSAVAVKAGTASDESGSSSDIGVSGYTLNVEEKTLENAEKAVIEQVLCEENWNKNIAAQKLKINRTTLYSKIKKYGIKSPHE